MMKKIVKIVPHWHYTVLSELTLIVYVCVFGDIVSFQGEVMGILPALGPLQVV